MSSAGLTSDSAATNHDKYFIRFNNILNFRGGVAPRAILNHRLNTNSTLRSWHFRPDHRQQQQINISSSYSFASFGIHSFHFYSPSTAREDICAINQHHRSYYSIFRMDFMFESVRSDMIFVNISAAFSADGTYRSCTTPLARSSRTWWTFNDMCLFLAETC